MMELALLSALDVEKEFAEPKSLDGLSLDALHESVSGVDGELGLCSPFALRGVVGDELLGDPSSFIARSFGGFGNDQRLVSSPSTPSESSPQVLFHGR